MTKSQIVVVVGSALCLTSLATHITAVRAAPVRIVDGSFHPADWVGFHWINDDPDVPGIGPRTSSVSISQIPAGGNPGAFQRTFHTIAHGDVIWSAVVYAPGIYNPAVQGAIESIDLYADLRHLSEGESAWDLILDQGGQTFLSNPIYTVSQSLSWDAHEQLGFSETDFINLFGGMNAPRHPDFSATGEPIAFGYAFGNVFPFPGVFVGEGKDVDNFEIVVNRSDREGFAFEEFSSVAGLNLVADAARADDNLRLTPASGGSVGAAWFNEKQIVANGFRSQFQFQITDPDFMGTDGFAFVIQNDSATAIGGNSGDIGYGNATGLRGIAKSIAIEFDTYPNAELGDPLAHHVSVHTRGNLENSAHEDFSLGAVNAPVFFDDGRTHQVDVVYQTDLRQLAVSLDGGPPLVNIPLDISSRLDLDAGRAWVGFTASTGGNHGSQDILDWSFSNEVTRFPYSFVLMGDEWNYLDDGSDQAIAWRAQDFDDSTWQKGAAQLGYGDGDESTEIHCGPTAPVCNDNNLATTYFRKSFELDARMEFDILTFLLQRDDAAAVYLNGVEIFRDDNLPADATFNTYATSGGDENGTVVFVASTSLLVPGTNVIAVEVHQRGPTSSDVSFDLALGGGFLGFGSPCDFDGNENCDVADVDLMFGAGDLSIGVALTPQNTRFDVNRDGILNSADIHAWLAEAATENGFGAPFLPGDTNLDGSVSPVDLNNLALGWRQAIRLWSAGDFDADGVVDAGDLNAIALNWRLELPRGATNVPEPRGHWLLLYAAVLVVAAKRDAVNDFWTAKTAPKMVAEVAKTSGASGTRPNSGESGYQDPSRRCAKRHKLHAFTGDGISQAMICSVMIMFLANLAASTSYCAAPETHFDGEFAPDNWTELILLDNDPTVPGLPPALSSGFSVQIQAGGNPGRFRNTVHTTVHGDLIGTGGIYKPSSYDPQSRGGINSLDVTFDWRQPSFSESRWQTLVQQDGITYAGPALRVLPHSFFWLTHEELGITAEDFTNARFEPGQPLHPDFSENGSELSFGYAFLTTLGQPGSSISDRGVDNWQLVINRTGVDGFEFKQFDASAGIQLVGDSGFVNNRLRLTPAQNGWVGAAWFEDPQSVADSFHASFRFQIDDPDFIGTDGFAFVIQNRAANTIGDGSGGGGYTGIENSVAIEFDTFPNAELLDPDGNHVSVHTRGLLPNSSHHAVSLGSGSPYLFYLDGLTHQVDVYYHAELHELAISLDGAPPNVSVPIDLRDTLDLDDGKAWIGFTAATGGNHGSQDILSWSFDNDVRGFPLTFVSTESRWKYLDDGSDQGSLWRELRYDDSSWPEGIGQLGYGDGDERTVVHCGPTAPACTDNNQATTYFRTTFELSGDIELDTNLNLQLLRDDAAAVYLNGVEVFRDSNLPDDATNTTYATSSSGDNFVVGFAVDAALLVAGTNIIAVEVHQSGPTSSDVSFGLGLSGALVSFGSDCDFDGNRICDVADLDQMYEIGDISQGVVVNGESALFDLNQDGIVNVLDVDSWLTIVATQNGFSAAYRHGDADLDAVVDSRDLNTLALNWRSSGRLWSTGDFDGDGVVEASDLNDIALNWRTTLPVAAGTGHSVPEPSGLVLLLAATFCWLPTKRMISCSNGRECCKKWSTKRWLRMR